LEDIHFKIGGMLEGQNKWLPYLSEINLTLYKLLGAEGVVGKVGEVKTAVENLHTGDWSLASIDFRLSQLVTLIKFAGNPGGAWAQIKASIDAFAGDQWIIGHDHTQRLTDIRGATLATSASISALPDAISSLTAAINGLKNLQVNVNLGEETIASEWRLEGLPT
jgi:hypothetical protein